MGFWPMMRVAAEIHLLVLLVLVAPSALAAANTNPVVDLGYARYKGTYNSTIDLNIFRGIRYAAPPVGQLRWQAPQAPVVNNTVIQSATDQPPLCPQSGGARLPQEYGFNSALGDEDCLYLNVFAPPGAKDLPVLLWIHGGGYGMFGAIYDPSDWINTSGKGFIAVMIQYRLGAFGFLSSEDVHNHGTTNAGLLDMRFALNWVKTHITHFGGDPKRVTIGGESSGAGGVMHQALAYGGREDNLFNNIIAASPYNPALFTYNHSVPTKHYQDFATLAGCSDRGKRSKLTVFECLVQAETKTLQYASGNVSTSGAWGTWAFLPVIDGSFIQGLPSKQLLKKKISGKRILSGNNANDGVPLSSPYVNTTKDFEGYIDTMFPFLTKDERSQLSSIYAVKSSHPENNSPRYDTLGDRGPTAVNQSEMATGLQQTVFDIFAEASFDCPSYWLVDAFSEHYDKESWKYQYSVTPAYHGADLTTYFSVGAKTPTGGFSHAFQKIWSNFIINNSPVIPVTEAKAGQDNATVPEGEDGLISWPAWDKVFPVLMDLNTTGGSKFLDQVTERLSYWRRDGPGVTNIFKLANATAWEGGRGERCEFWRNVGPHVPQ